jgi:hypothetical protein
MLLRPFAFGAGFLLFLAAEASAEPTKRLSTQLFLLAGSGAFDAARPPEREGVVDPGTFATELFAYLTQEILPDSPEEYRGSLIPSRLNDRWWQTSAATTGKLATWGSKSQFGDHCLLVIDRIFDSTKPALPASFAGAGVSSAASFVPFLARSAAAFFLLRDVFSANESNEHPRAFSLQPRLSARRAEARLVIRW